MKKEGGEVEWIRERERMKVEGSRGAERSRIEGESKEGEGQRQ